MAGLLDIFGTSGQETMGLLGMSPEDIGRSRDEAQAQALFALAGRLFKGGSGASSVLEGLQQGQQAYKTAMQGGLQEQLQKAQLQEMLKKKQLEEKQRKDELIAAEIFKRGYKPAMAGQASMPIEEDGRFIGDSQAIAAQPAKFDIASIAPELMMAGPAGQARLKTALELNKSMAGETFKLGEGEKQYQRNPLTGEITEVATGAPKKEDIAGSLKEARQFLGITTPVNEMTTTERALVKAYVDRKDANLAPKVAVDLKDPTAVAKAQADLLKDWRGVTKDTGAFEVADRFKAAQVAVQQGNAGNKSADGALIYSIAKVWDPTGSVMEGDKESIRGNRSIPQSIKAYAEKIFNGAQLLPEERAGLLSVTAGIVEQKSKNLEKQKAPYVNLAKQFGGSGDLLLNPLSDVLQNKELVNPSSADIQSAVAAEIARRRKVKQ
jgi:hypothetical protein